VDSKQADGPIKRSFIGDPGKALDVARRTAAEVPAYARLLQSAGRLENLLGGTCAFEDLPVIDKDTYCFSNKPGDLIPPSLRGKVNGLFSSSGSSGKPFYWPRLKGAVNSLSLPRWLDENFGIGQKPTLAVVALNMDGWTAGMNTALGLNQFALEAPFPFMVCCPGNDYEQALRTIGEMHELVSQIVVFIYPVAIPHFLRLAEDSGVKLPLRKMRFATTGDPFSESFREHLDKLCGAAWPETALASYSYSSADTRVIGTESRVSRALSRLLYHDPGLRRAFGLEAALPNLYISVPHEELPLIEDVDGELVFTRWQPIPIVRYNLHDKGELWDRAAVRARVLSAVLPDNLRPLREEFVRQESAPGDFVAVYGRSRSLYFYGMYLDESAFSGIMDHPELKPFATGLFRVRLTGGEFYPRIEWDIEINKGRADLSALDPLFYRVLVDGLMKAYPHFGVNYRNFLQKWDPDPAKRIFKLNFHAYPALSDKFRDTRKHRIIRP
jgi:phenylacetate-CoA ligase